MQAQEGVNSDDTINHIIQCEKIQLATSTRGHNLQLLRKRFDLDICLTQLDFAKSIKENKNNLRKYIKNGLLNVKDQGTFVNNFIHWWIANDNTEQTLSILEELKKQNLLKYLDMKAKDANSKNPLFFAIAKKYIDPKCGHYTKYALFDQKLIDFLIESASKDILLAQDKEGNNSLHIAILKRDRDNINKLIAKAEQLECLDQLIGQKNIENLKPAQMINKAYKDSKSIIEEIYLASGGIFMQEELWGNSYHSVNNILDAKLSQYEMKEKKITTSVNHVETDSQKEITQIICDLMKSLNLSHENILAIFDLAKQCQGFTNKKIEIKRQIRVKNLQVKEQVVDKMMKFSFLFQKKCKEKNILSPVNGKKVGLRTKRVFEIIDRQTLSNLLKEKQNNQRL